jgi:hypothetical protein
MITILLIISWQIYNSFKLTKKWVSGKNTTKKINKINIFKKLWQFLDWP